MELPPDILERIATLGESERTFVEVARDEGLDFVRRILSGYEKSQAVFRQWSPILFDYAAECRARNRCPVPAAADVRERAKLSLYDTTIANCQDKMQNTRPNCAAIFTLPALALPAAMRGWPGQCDRAVFLTFEEWSEWNERFTPPDISPWWYCHYWWDIEDPPQQYEDRLRQNAAEVPCGTEPWVVISGVMWERMSGGETAELWLWDGREARFKDYVGCSSF